MLIHSILDAVGNTPLISLKKLSSGNVFVKAEHLNPGGSVKDRVAKYIIESAEKQGKLKPGMIIIEATSGNTGRGLALIGRIKGYEVVCIMPENMSEERKKIIRAFGGEIVFSPAEGSLSASLKKLKEIIGPETLRKISSPISSAIRTIRRFITCKQLRKSGRTQAAASMFL